MYEMFVFTFNIVDIVSSCECWKWSQNAPENTNNPKIFPGGACPQTPLVVVGPLGPPGAQYCHCYLAPPT